MCLKTSVQIVPPCHNLVQQTVCASYAALRCLFVGYAWRAIFAIIHLVVLSDRPQNVLQRGFAALPRVRDILIPIASDVYLEGMPGKLWQGLRCSAKNPVLQTICTYFAAKWQRH